MSMRDQQLILTVPRAIQQNIPSVADDQVFPPLASPISNQHQEEEDQSIEHHASIAVDYGTSLWKKVQGLVRVKDHARNNYFYYSNEFTERINGIWPLWDLDAGLPPSSLAYEKYRQDALEEFLAYTAVTTMVEDSN